MFEQFLKAGHAFRLEAGDTDTESEFVSASFACVVRFEIIVEPADCFFFAHAEICDEHCKFVAAEPCDDVGTAETAIENRRGADEGVVAFVMSKLVVDLFHSVEIDEQQE